MEDLPAHILLPPRPAAVCRESVEGYARECLNALHMEEWGFGWDRARLRLGCCHLRECRITLSRHMLECCMEAAPEQVWRTLLHELAHALAWEFHSYAGHGFIWRHYCTLLGIPGERARVPQGAVPMPALPERPVRYVLCHAETGEVFRRYFRRPRLSPRRLAHSYMPGRKEETYGKLILRPAEEQDF